ncbi:MAG: hypothetical protein IPP22_11355 [Nitrosomonas sp.]|nr:hypothetical protein [Nitrosomonas sp.]
MNPVSGSSEDYSFYSALSHPPLRAAGTTPDLAIYRPKAVPKYGAFRFKAPAEGLLQIGGAI